TLCSRCFRRSAFGGGSGSRFGTLFAFLLGGLLLLSGGDLNDASFGEADGALAILPGFLRFHLQNAFAALENVARTDQTALSLQAFVDCHWTFSVVIVVKRYFQNVA